MKKSFFIILFIVVAISLVAFKIFSPKQDKYIYGTVERRSITEIVSESGMVVTNGRVDVYSPTNGVIEKVYVSNGDNVKERQKLFTVKSTATPQEKMEAFALYQAAKSAVQQAENTRRSTIATVNRVHDDVKNHDTDETFLQKETRTLAEVANDNAYDALLAAQAQLASAQINYYATLNSTVTSPVSGLISNLSIIPGTRVLINNPLVPSTPLLLIGNLGTTDIVVSVGESEINKISEGQPADVRFDAVENKIYKGVVHRHDGSGTSTAGIAKFNVYITITDADENIKPGMNADADIVTKELKDVLSVPNTAIKPYQKGRAVRVIGKNGEIEYLPVQIGVKGKEYTQILGGLSEGQKFILTLSSEQTTKSSIFKI